MIALASGLAEEPSGRPGRPRILPATVLWASLAIGVLRGAMSQAAVWRLAMNRGLWRGAPVQISDQAVYKRLAAADPSPLATLFAALTAQLQARVSPEAAPLAPFAAAVVVLDETTLDPIARFLPSLRAVPPGDDRLLPGTLAGVFDVRRQLWRTLQLIESSHQNEKIAARDLVATLAPGSLILADLGSFGFAWFDDLTDAGHWWVSRLRAKTSYRVVHVHYQDDQTFDGLVWLGAHRADRAKHLVRLVRFQASGRERAFLTNVRTPSLLSIAEIAARYARRGDIELAVKLVKRELGLHLLWSAKPQVIVHQIWAVLLIAQILQALRGEVAARAGVDDGDVSMALLIAYLPTYAAGSEDPIAAFVADGVRLRFIRPSTRGRPSAPVIPADHMTPAPSDLITAQTPRYAGRRCSPTPSVIN